MAGDCYAPLGLCTFFVSKPRAALVPRLPWAGLWQAVGLKIKNQHAEVVLRAAQRANHGLRVGIDPLRREQHVGAVVEFLHHAGTVQEADHRLQGLVREAQFVRQAAREQFAQVP
jgi:hypothetical protein